MSIEDFRQRRAYRGRETLEALGAVQHVDLEENSFELTDTPAPQLRFSGAALLWMLLVGIALGCVFGRWGWPHMFGH